MNDLFLARKYEPVMLFSKDKSGDPEYFFPMAASDYVRDCGIWDKKKRDWYLFPGKVRLRDLGELADSGHYYLTYSTNVDDALPEFWSRGVYPNFRMDQETGELQLVVPAGEDSVGILNGLIDELSTEFSTELSDASPQLIEIPTEEQEYWKMLRQTQEKNDLSSLMSATALPDLDRAENGIFVPQQYLKLTMPGNKKLANLYARAKTKYEKVKKRDRPVYHFRVCRDNWKGKRLCVLQYWFFYAFNDWKIAHKGYNDHEGDWEMITVFLQLKQEKDLEPVAVAYSRHISKETVKWQKISPITMGQLNKHSGPARLGNHPLVFVGCGSHASYPERGRHHLNKRDYALGNSDIILPQGSATQGRLKWARPIQIDNKVWNWNFKGGWGAHIGALGALYGAWGPDGPAHKESWDKPADWARP